MQIQTGDLEEKYQSLVTALPQYIAEGNGRAINEGIAAIDQEIHAILEALDRQELQE